MRTLQHLTSRTGHLADLVGTGWSHHYRCLHPASEDRDGRRVDLRWMDVAAARGVQIDPATAEWHAVSGYRLHHPPPADTLSEPAAGPTPSVLLPVLRTVAAGRKVGEVLLAEWTGYDESQAGRDLHGAVSEGVRTLARLEYSVWRTSLTQAVELIRADQTFRSPRDRTLLANFIWDPSEDWLVAADGDLASTYLATSFPVGHWDPELEWTEVTEDAPLS
jgi:hypothetical protein